MKQGHTYTSLREATLIQQSLVNTNERKSRQISGHWKMEIILLVKITLNSLEYCTIDSDLTFNNHYNLKFVLKKTTTKKKPQGS